VPTPPTRDVSQLMRIATKPYQGFRLSEQRWSLAAGCCERTHSASPLWLSRRSVLVVHRHRANETAVPVFPRALPLQSLRLIIRTHRLCDHCLLRSVDRAVPAQNTWQHDARTMAMRYIGGCAELMADAWLAPQSTRPRPVVTVYKLVFCGQPRS
jgi:hypothetical protein